MTCWNGHMPQMSDDQMAQAIHAYMHAFEARWREQPWAPPMEEPSRKSSPKAKSRTSLPEAREVDKAGAIEVEFVRVR